MDAARTSKCNVSGPVLQATVPHAQLCTYARVFLPQVEALAGKRVMHAACGVWHSAAIAAEPLGGAGSPGPDTSALSWQEGQAIRQKLAAAYELLEQARCTGHMAPKYMGCPDLLAC